jgi:hypothetical protein
VSQLIAEILLRLSKVGAATLIGGVIYFVAAGPLGGPPSVELGLLAWLAGAAVVLLVENSPI